MTTSQHPDLQFEARLRRLKEVLRVEEDQEVAGALGMTKAALSLRKKRGAFPRDKLVSLAASRPDLGLDVVYVMSGIVRAQSPLRAQADEVLGILGAIPPGTFEQQELLVDLALKAAEQLRVLRQERAATYQAILAALDRAEAATVDRVRSLAEQLSAADREARLARLNARAADKGGNVADVAVMMELLDKLAGLNHGLTAPTLPSQPPGASVGGEPAANS